MKGSKIMIVEDEIITAKGLKKVVKDFGYLVTSTEVSGEKAVQQAEKNKPDLVLMDIMLKEKMDGIEAAEIIRTKFGIPIIFLTAYADDRMLKRAKITEPYGYIIKPYQNRELYISIEMSLYKHKIERERAQAEEERKRLIQKLQDALAKVKLLSGFLPICANCKKIRDDKGYWAQIEAYVKEHSEAEFTHGICPECAKKLYPEFYT